LEICHQEYPRESGGAEIEQDVSTPVYDDGVNLLGGNI
jgi:hypothetical protein